MKNYLPIVFNNIEDFYKNNRTLLLENDKYRPCKSLTRDIIATIDKFVFFYNDHGQQNEITMDQIINDVCGFSEVQDVVNTNIRVMKELGFLYQGENNIYKFTSTFIEFVKSKINTKDYLYNLISDCDSIDKFNMLFNGIICALREGYLCGKIINFPDSNDEFHRLVPDKNKRLDYCKLIFDIYGFHGRNKPIDSDCYTPNPNYRIITILKLLDLIVPDEVIDGMNTFVLSEKGISLLKSFDSNLYKFFDEDNKPIDENSRLTGGENIILYGVPGAGKSYTIKNEYCNNEEYMERLVFHPDYTYSDFVGQIMPKIGDDNRITYEFTPGPFTKLVKKAYRNPEKMYYLVIEEVNRGNAPAIFGDVFQLLDRDDKGASEYQITNADVAKTVYKDENHKVSIPSNMSILCTMNTSDQNVFTLDTAFQRRWNMRLIQNKFPDDSSEDKFANTKILDTSVTWEKFFTEINNLILNKNIRMTSAEDKRLGTHFVNQSDLIPDEYSGDNPNLLKNAKRHNRKFAEKVLKYLWDDAFKFNKDEIFDITKVNSLEKVISEFTSVNGDERFTKIFKQNIVDSLIPKKD